MKRIKYHEKYLKYKLKYLNLKNGGNIDHSSYTFVGPDNEIAKKHFDRIVELNNICFPVNVNDSSKIDLFNQKKNQLIKKFIDQFNFFYVFNKELLIGYCFVYNSSVTKYDHLETYKKIKSTPKQISKILNAENVDIIEIAGLCKDLSFPNVGTFLLDKVCEYYKSRGVNRIYLVAGSDYYKNNYEAYVNYNSCVLTDDNKFYDSNMELIEYYNKNGFTVSDNLYSIDFCNDGIHYISYNVLYKNL
ncbi:acyl-CoA N-acyltransferase [Fadolivirus algeromassiliense]|jgi:hypothetical protein|uniref:Acyl-CoA N-acyltransferase n=1 Tax=Fadolivirus FV1/VV64 TaxID=3070911 RepID=A0A7D3QV12_9VIRU|nr:acyl-CoA N-acyltransferase [Fadolivirus algeromassiliense]QKF94623.1 acyl-CoA N-acyltransferase [Fadolivirus FV1/VV64]